MDPAASLNGRSWLTGEELMICLALSQARTADIVVMAAAAGFDALYVDLEHSSMSLETTALLCTVAHGCHLPALVRVPSADPPMLARVLDLGARGVIVPHIDSVEAARSVVDSCRFPPEGHRSIYLANPLTGYATLDPAAALAQLSEITVVALMVESVRGVKACADLAAVDGVDMVIVGAFDLSAELGVLGDFDHLDFEAALRDVGAACRDHGVVFGLAGVARPDQLARFVDLGVSFVSAGTDASLFQAGARARLEQLRALSVPRPQGGSS